MDENDREYLNLLIETFNHPFLSFRGLKSLQFEIWYVNHLHIVIACVFLVFVNLQDSVLLIIIYLIGINFR